jgi:hypothetical protein
MRYVPALILLAALTACGKSDNDPGPGGVTVGEAKALDQAAEMLEQRRMPAEALHSPAASPAPAPATTAASPIP